MFMLRSCCWLGRYNLDAPQAFWTGQDTNVDITVHTEVNDDCWIAFHFSLLITCLAFKICKHSITWLSKMSSIIFIRRCILFYLSCFALKSIILFNLFPSINEYQVKQNEILIYSNFHILVTLLTVLSFYDKN